MLTKIVKKEFLESVYSTRFVFICAIFIGLVPLGFYVNSIDYQQKFSEFQETQRMYLSSLKGTVSLNFQAEGHRPPSPLGVFAAGLEEKLPNKIITDRTNGVQLVNTRSIDNPQLTLFGKVDYLFIVGVVASLIALLIISDSIPGEKELGTLRMLLANPVARSTLLMAKLIANFSVLLVPFLLSFIIGLILMTASGSVDLWSGETPVRIILIFMVSVVFMVCFLTLGLMIVNLSHRTTSSLTTLLLVWVLIVLAYPRISSMIAQVIYPVRSEQLFNLQKRYQKEAIEQERDQKVRELYDEMARQVGESLTSVSISQDLTDFQKAYLDRKEPIDQQFEARIRKELQEMENDYWRRKRTQEDIATYLSRLSPLSCFAYVVSELANTGTTEIRHLVENAGRFQDKIEDEVYGKIHVVRIGGTSGSTASFTRVDPGLPKKDEISRFEYNPPALGKTLYDSLADIVILVLYCFLFFGMSYFLFIRYDAR